VPNPQLFTALAITYAAYRGGYAGGLVGAAIGVAYALYFFSSPDGFFHYTANNRVKVAVNVITLPAMALLVSRLSHKLAASLHGHTERFVESANAPILGVDREGKVSVWNRSLEKATGWSERELKNRSLADLLPSEEQKTAFEEAFEAVLDGHDTPSLEFSISTRTGDPIQVLLSFTPKFDTRDNVVGMTGVGQDITDRKKAEGALKESELKLREILENSPLGIAIVSHDVDGTRMTGDRLFVNSALVQMFGGTSRESFIKSEIQDSWVDLEQLKAVEEVFKGRRELIDFEARRRRMDGIEWWVSMNTRPIRFEGQDCTMVWHFDITERKRIEETLTQSEERFRAFIENSPSAILIKDIEGRYLVANRRWHDWFNPAGREISGKTVFDFYQDEHARKITQSDNDVVKTETPLEMELTTPFADGTSRVTLLQKFPIFDPEGKITAIGGINTDVTERKSMEEQLRQAQKMEAVGQLTGGVAHDFNNLLAVIMGNTELLETRFGREDKPYQAILRAATRGAELTQRLLAYSRQQPLRPQALVLATLVEGMSEMLARTLGETIEVETSADPDLWNALADPGQVENALLNLALNARDAMPEGGKLTIECRNASLNEAYVARNPEATAGDYVLLALRDTGTGMSAKVQAHAFEPFFTTKEVGQGSGLGLSMVYGFAKQSGGHVIIHSKEGEGTTVEIYLPRGEEVSGAKEAAPSEESPRGRNETVLVLEDDEDVRATVVAVLKGLGYRAIAVPAADKALEALETEQIEVVLSDVVLPGGMSGPDFAEEAIRRHPGTKVVFMSGYSAEAKKHPGLCAPESVLLNKPFEKEQFAQALRQALD
jgi:PAS domain S-box-containing protein